MIDIYTYRTIVFIAMGCAAGGTALLILGWMLIENLIENARGRRRIAEAHRQLAALSAVERRILNRYLAGVGPKP